MAEGDAYVSQGRVHAAKRETHADFSHVRALSLWRDRDAEERVSEKREGHANRWLHVCRGIPASKTRLVSFARRSARRC